MSKEKNNLFPHEKAREIQNKLIKVVEGSLEDKRDLIVHAPTGLGKTAATLAPALAHAIDNKLTVFFLTSRHTQHKIAIETLKKVKEKHGADFACIDVIGKKWMCIDPTVDGLYGMDFSEYCKKQREDEKCEFYLNMKKGGKLTAKAKKVIEKIKKSPYNNEEIIEMCRQENVCPYEITMNVARDAHVIVADYYYAFNPSIRNTFFTKSSKDLGEAILIVDEGHNLPQRCRELYTHKLTSFMLERGIKEAAKFGFLEIVNQLNAIKAALETLANGLEQTKEGLVSKKDFMEGVGSEEEYDEIIEEFNKAADEIREKQKQSYIGGIVGFLEYWLGEDEGFARIITVSHDSIRLMYKCLDPSISTKDILSDVYCTILMSGTLTPTSMYKDILGFSDVNEVVFGSPFPKNNRLSLIVPETTTKFTKRNDEQYKNIANVLVKIKNSVPGNIAVYFPSYSLRDDVYMRFHDIYGTRDNILLEKPMLSKAEKENLLSSFKDLKDKGGMLLAIASGSFGEGIDLPGDYLKGVVVVGLPLEKPSLETKQLIEYYDKKFGKGWDYGYIFPAITKTLQNAGRCIRSGSDKGVVVFLDERYVWPRYMNCFPPDYEAKISDSYEKDIKNFFSN
ncbi:ATP-dependent DNA helicase [Candidatus Woesearchaeota archaeon]|nr:ATP-dependent DNA helicase [Candidatus Woesearchaeota archaeon]